MMKCPVCKTDCNNLNRCPECGFSEVGKIFINQEEAEQWFETTVIPYKNNYYQSKILPPVDWLEIFKQNSEAKRLFEFSIPIAIKRRTELELLKDPKDDDYSEYLEDATLGHIAIVSASEMIRKHFMDAIEEAYLRTTTFKMTSLAAIEREGDLNAILLSLEPGSALVLETGCNVEKNVTKHFSKALSEFFIEITIGKGQGARQVSLDLSVFTAVFLADSISNIPADIANTLSSIIEFNPSQDELNELQIREVALLYDVQLTKANIEVIKEYNPQIDFKTAKRILRDISDYLYLHTEIQQPLNADAMREILENNC